VLPANSTPQGTGETLRLIEDAATQEGKIVVGISGGLPESWRQRFEAALNYQFGIKVELAAVDSSGPAPTSLRPPDGGARPAWDVLIGSDAQYAELATSGLLQRHGWSSLFGAPRDAVMFDESAVGFAQQPLRPAYNSQRVPASAVPHTWDALLDPKWKGRIGVSNSMDPWAGLSSSWGDAKTVQFITALAAQQPARGTAAELMQRLEQGSIDVVAAVPEQLIQASVGRNAPVSGADVSPLLLQSSVAGGLKNVEHPNAGLLFAGLLATLEGQTLWHDFAGSSSIFVADSPGEKLVEGKQYVLPPDSFLMKDAPDRSAKYARVLGY